MQRIIFIIMCWLSFGIIAFGEPGIEVIYPCKDQKMTVSSGTYILGNVYPRNGRLSINGYEVPVYRTGGFLAYLPVKKGNFNFSCKLTLPNGKIIKKTIPVYIRKPKKMQTTGRSVIEDSSYLPDKNLGVLIGEEMTFQCKTLPNKEVICKIDKTEDSFPLYEQTVNGVKGIYRTTKVFYQPIRDSSFRFEVANDSSIKAFRPRNKLSVLPPYEYPVLQVVEDLAKARYTPGGGYNTFLRKGTILQSTGYAGEWYRILLSKNHPVFVQKNQMNLNKKGAKTSATKVGNLTCWEDSKAVYIKLLNVDPVNSIWVEYPGEKRIGLLMYQTTSQINRIFFQPGIENLEDLKWMQVEDDVLLLDFYLNYPPYYGYFIEYKEDYALITLKKSLKDVPRSKIKICLDAGHGGSDTGARGPTGKVEREITLEQIKKIGHKLKEKKFDVIYTRTGQFGPSLYERAPYAFQQKADVFISVHYNSAADGANPYKIRATETYYYNRPGKKLGESIHSTIIDETGLKNGGLKYGDLAVCRNNAVPSILLELDYIIIPSAEERIQTDEFQNKIAEAVTQGMMKYIKQSE